MTREEWLKKAVRTLRPFVERKANIKMHSRWQVSMSLTGKRSAIGLCCYEPHSASGQTVNIMICPTHKTAEDVLDTLVHEMIHASLPRGAHHGSKFVAACKCVGWTRNKPTSAAADDDMRVLLKRVAAFLGPFPHDPFVMVKGKGTKGGYWPVFESIHDPRYRVQISERALSEYGVPSDPWGDEMVKAEGRAPKWPPLPSGTDQG